MKTIVITTSSKAKLPIVILGALFALMLGGCADLMNAIKGNPNIGTLINLSRIAGRVIITAELTSRHVPAADVTAFFAVIDPAIDQAIAGNKIQILLDPVAFAPVRAQLDAAISKALLGLKVKGVPIFDAVSAQQLADAAVSAVVTAIKPYVPQAPPSLTP